MATINWQSTVAQLDADPDIATPAGKAVLSALVSAGQLYDTAGRPDVLYESSEHQQWASRQASQRLGQNEPSYFDSAFYSRPFARFVSSAPLVRDPSMPVTAPPHAKQAFAFWRPRDPAVARNISSYYIAKEREEQQARLPIGPTSGAIQQALVSALSAAQAWLAS